ncbi:hypothetical protein I2I05_08670 [Hymenobacter sp. BT683]|uniref:DNA-directed DNA polymerase family A palm domain-containing protein n=1 Tax=Hymenobacter jeongseonensis TaxID=2791027 RepID=A0ABS0II41_9BACT|nr:hypothetical protein [Hymenobacter jeongseonensis]MBF9237470.1 hypothetical protein [Hymenobacter jeongseonensis]
MYHHHLFGPSLIDVRATFDHIDFDTAFDGEFAHIERNKTLYLDNHVDKYHYILNRIHEGHVFNRTTVQGYASINLADLREFIGKRYADECLKLMKLLGWIQCDNWRVYGQKSFGYRIAPNFVSTAIGHLVFKDEVMGRKLRLRTAANNKANQKLVTWKNLRQIRIHDREALGFVDAKLAFSLQYLEAYRGQLSLISTPADVKAEAYNEIRWAWSHPTYWLNHSVYGLLNVNDARLALAQDDNAGLTLYGILKNSIVNQHGTDQIAISKIANLHFFHKRKVSKSRLYTNLSNISTELRKFLYHKDHAYNPLVNLDIRNSQPFILACLLKKQYGDASILPEDVQHFIDLTMTGKFYDCIMDRMNIAATERKEFKVQFFANIFFCTNEYAKRTQDGKLFKELFPNVYAIIVQMKTKDALGGHEKLAIAMQHLEADIILGAVGKKLEAEGIWYNTIHDSVVVSIQAADRTRELMLEAFRQEVGIVPTINTEVLTVVTADIKANILKDENDDDIMMMSMAA